MGYTNYLTDEDRNALYNIIGGKAFRTLFIGQTDLFNRIRPGFRANKLTDADAVALAIRNNKEALISDHVEELTKNELNNVASRITQLEDAGISSDEAKAEALLDSVFSSSIELYFKLKRDEIPAEKIDKLYEIMKRLKEEHLSEEGQEENNSDSVVDSDSNDDSTETKQLREEIASLREKIKTAEKKYNAEKAELEKRLSKAQEEIESLHETGVPDSIEVNEPGYLAQFDDKMPILPTEDTDEIWSLCEVYDSNGQNMLWRLADIDYEGIFNIFQVDESIPPYFENREALFFKDGPSDIGSIAVWNWKAIQNKNDPNKDYVVAEFNPEIAPIEIVLVKEYKSLEAMINALKKGCQLEAFWGSTKLMLAVHIEKERYAGVLCNQKDLVCTDGVTAFANELLNVPVYEFTSSEILRITGDYYIYSKVAAGEPKKVVVLKNAQEIVRTIILDSISWSLFKQRGASRAEYKEFKKFISEVPTDEVKNKVAESCHCTIAQAEQYINNFCKNAFEYLDGDSIDDDIIASAIYAEPELMSRAKSIVEEEWKEENSEAVKLAEESLNSIKSEVHSTNVTLDERKNELERVNKEIDRLTDTYAEKEKLASDVEAAVAQRIQKAKDNAAEFIASMAFTGAHQISELPPVIGDGISKRPEYILIEGKIDSENMCEHREWTDVVETMSYELVEAGVASNYSRPMAACLCAAYIDRQAVVIVGPNAMDIVDAFTAALNHKRRGIIYCEGEYTNQGFPKIDCEIVELVNLFSGSWMNRFPEILSKTDSFYIATHPYAEDIQLEPKSLYGLVTPIFTEFLVDKKPEGKYVGGYFAENFKEYDYDLVKPIESRGISALSVTPLVKSRMQRLMYIMHSIYAGMKVDDEFMFVLLPYMFATLQMDKLANMFSDQGGIQISASLKRHLRFILGDQQ